MRENAIQKARDKTNYTIIQMSYNNYYSSQCNTYFIVYIIYQVEIIKYYLLLSKHI